VGSTFALGLVSAAVIARLTTHLPLAARLTSSDGTIRIADEIPQAWLRDASFVPFVAVEGGTVRPFNTMGGPDRPKWGEVDGLQVRVVSQFRGDQEAAELMSLVKQRLDGQPLTVAGYPSVGVTFEGADPS
jgi:hypothetical protein